MEDGDKSVHPKKDVWALGVTIYKLLFNKTPFEGPSRADVIGKIKEAKIRFPKTP